MLIQFLIPSANDQTFLVVLLGLFLLSGRIYTVCICMLYLDYALMCHSDDKGASSSGQASSLLLMESTFQHFILSVTHRAA